MALETITLKLASRRPLLMHNARLANPREGVTKALKEATSKRKKTDADLELIARLEWMGGLYQDEAGRPCIPEDVLLGAVCAGARKSKLGKDALAGVMGAEPFFPLQYDGPTDIMELYECGKFCDFRRTAVQGKAVMRSRPRFNRWTADVALLVETSTINPKAVRDALATAGALIGIGDFRPRFGLFDVQST